MDHVELEFEPEALKAIADLAIERGTGARGLRAIIESAMMDIMYDIPDRTDVIKCVITKDTIKTSKPMLVMGDSAQECNQLPEPNNGSTQEIVS